MEKSAEDMDKRNNLNYKMKNLYIIYNGKIVNLYAFK